MATTVEAYRRIETVARAQGLTVVNAGYVYDADILTRLGDSGWDVRELGGGDLVQVLQDPDPDRRDQVALAVEMARIVLTGEDCDVLARRFEPQTVPAVLLRDREQEFQRELHTEHSHHDEAWADLLGAFAQESAQPRRALVLNDAAPVVQQLLASTGTVFEAGLRSLYLSATMLAGEGLRAREVELMNDALSVLLDASLKGAQQ